MFLFGHKTALVWSGTDQMFPSQRLDQADILRSNYRDKIDLDIS